MSVKDNTVWALSCGQYSDWRIIALFESKSLAKKYLPKLDVYQQQDANIFSMHVYGEGDFVQRIERGPLWVVTMDHRGGRARAREISMVDELDGDFISSGNVPKPKPNTTYLFHDMEGGHPTGWQYKNALAKGWKCQPDNFWITTSCHARTEEEAIKIANERRIGVIQHPEWWKRESYGAGDAS